MGQVRTEEKSNEITAIAALLGALDIRGGTVSMDAMGCQKAIAQQIIVQDAHYLLVVKGNQPTLLADIVQYFEWAPKDPMEKKFLQKHTGRSPSVMLDGSKVKSSGPCSIHLSM